MFNKILVPLDGSTTAESALPLVRSLARRLAIPTAVNDLARKLDLEVVLVRAYAIPYGAYSTGNGFYDPVNL